MPELQTGTISLNPKGFGFVRTDSGESYFVPPVFAKRFVSGDTVSFEVKSDPRSGKLAANEVRLLQGNSRLILGVVEYDQDTGVARLVTEDYNVLALYVDTPVVVNEDVVVAARIIPQSRKGGSVNNIRVQIERVIGSRASEAFGAAYALARNDLRCHFPQEVVMDAFRAANELSGTDDGRVDMRGVYFVTIDGEKTKDIDDAVLVEKAADGGFLVQVAIADVSHYVRPGSLLDKEAQSRATSVYMPGAVVPMLPLALSAGACSLSPNNDRKAVVLSMTTDAQGVVKSYKFVRALIRSKGALTYTGVSAFLDQGDISKLPPVATAVYESLRNMKALHDVLAETRNSRGRLDLDGPNITVVRGKERRYELVIEERNIAERVIESMMLLANTTTAEHLARAKGSAGIYRTQSAPSAEQWKEMNELLKTLYGVECDSATPDVSSLLRLLAKFPTDSEEYSVIFNAFQSLVSRAVYTNAPQQHFSLNVPQYTQFTSPIRRYADLVVHRLVLGAEQTAVAAEALANQFTDLSSRASFAENDITDKAKKIVYLTSYADLPDAQRPVEAAVVLRNMAKGVRVRIPARQFTAVIPEAELLRTGHRYDETRESWVRSNGFPLVPGCLYNVVLMGWRETNYSYDLTVAIS